MRASLWRKINMGRDHRWAGPRMSAYVEGDLSERQRRRLAAHTTICPECHRVLGTLREMIAAMGRLGRPKPPPADRVAANVVARIRENPQR